MLKVLALCAVAASALPAMADDTASAARGKALVETNCVRCHGIGTSDKSVHPQAPEFRLLSERYPLDALEEAFVEGIYSGHPDMPEFVATPVQIADIITYLSTLNPE